MGDINDFGNGSSNGYIETFYWLGRKCSKNISFTPSFKLVKNK